MKKTGIGFLGCGNIGCGVYRLIMEHSAVMEENEGVAFDVRRVLVRSLGKKRSIDVPQAIMTDKASDVLGDQVVRILDPAAFVSVLETGRHIHDQRVYLAEYQRYVEQTIVYDNESRLLIGILRDVTEEQNAHEKKDRITAQTVEVADRVVEKQMRIVQEIASLLGETAAETKIALAKLKESIINE